MNAQEFRNLQEAYSEVYQEIDEAKVDAGKSSTQKMSDRNVRNNLGRSSRRSLNKVYRGHTKKSLDIPARDMSPTPHGKTDDGKGRYWTKMIAKERSANEEVEIYNIVLSHLLDEGYAETEKAAEAIVENMSEEWINFVVETKLGYAAQKIANIARSKGDTKKEMQARKLATRQFSSAADPAKHGKANVNRARQQAKQRQERQPEDRYDDHPSLSARERNPNLR